MIHAPTASVSTGPTHKHARVERLVVHQRHEGSSGGGARGGVGGGAGRHSAAVAVSLCTPVSGLFSSFQARPVAIDTE